METSPPSDPRSDEALVEAANNGDAGAFEALYRRYRDWVVALAYRFTDDRDLSLDVMQDTFTYLLKKFPGFELRAALKTFLYPVVRHIALRHRRKLRRYASDRFPLEEFAALHAAPDQDPKAELAAVMAALPEAQREVLLLRFVDDLTLQEIAAALSIPVGTVKSRMHIALAALRADPRTREHFRPPSEPRPRGMAP